MQKQIYTFLSLFLVLVIDMMGTGITMPVLASLFSDVGSGLLPAGASLTFANVLYGVTNTAFFIFLFIGSPLMGDLSDQIGRKRVLLICLIGAATGFFVSGLGILLQNIPLLILGRCIGGFATGCQPIATAAIIDLSTPENKAKNLSLITLAICIGFVIGPILGGYFSNGFIAGLQGFALPFWIATFLALLNATALYFTFSETRIVTLKHKLSLVKALRDVQVAFTNPALYKLSTAFLFMQLGWSIYFQFISLYLAQSANYTSGQIGIFMAYIGAIFSLTLTVIVRLVVNRWTIKKTVLRSLVVAFVSAFIAAFFVDVTMQWILAFPLALGLGLSYTAFLTLFSNSVDQDSQGLVMGITASVASVAWIMGGLSISVLANMHLIWPFLFTGFCWVVATIIIARQKSNEKG